MDRVFLWLFNYVIGLGETVGTRNALAVPWGALVCDAALVDYLGNEWEK